MKNLMRYVMLACLLGVGARFLMAIDADFADIATTEEEDSAEQATQTVDESAPKAARIIGSQDADAALAGRQSAARSNAKAARTLGIDNPDDFNAARSEAKKTAVSGRAQSRAKVAKTLGDEESDAALAGKQSVARSNAKAARTLGIDNADDFNAAQARAQRPVAKLTPESRAKIAKKLGIKPSEVDAAIAGEPVSSSDTITERSAARSKAKVAQVRGINDPQELDTALAQGVDPKVRTAEVLDQAKINANRAAIGHSANAENLAAEKSRLNTELSGLYNDIIAGDATEVKAALANVNKAEAAVESAAISEKKSLLWASSQKIDADIAQANHDIAVAKSSAQKNALLAKLETLRTSKAQLNAQISTEKLTERQANLQQVLQELSESRETLEANKDQIAGAADTIALVEKKQQALEAELTKTENSLARLKNTGKASPASTPRSLTSAREESKSGATPRTAAQQEAKPSFWKRWFSRS